MSTDIQFSPISDQTETPTIESCIQASFGNVGLATFQKMQEALKDKWQDLQIIFEPSNNTFILLTGEKIKHTEIGEVFFKKIPRPSQGWYPRIEKPDSDGNFIISFFSLSYQR